LGNLESGWMGDSRFPRRVTLDVPAQRVGLTPGTRYRACAVNVDTPPTEADADAPPGVLRFSVGVPASGCLVLRLEPEP
jgi:hypothetical protein